jgi:phage repressor protein C with HTH and peptisase S24 domain
MISTDRLCYAMEERKISQTQLAKLVGISSSMIGKLVRGEARGSTHLLKIAQALKTSPEYLIGEEVMLDANPLMMPSGDDLVEQLGLVPVREIDLRYGMGATELEVPVTSTVRHFARDWIRTYTGASPDHLYFAQGIGDSMAPTILNSDLLLIDSSEQTLHLADKIWACAYGNSGMVKRLRQMADGSVKIMSDNQNVRDEIAYDGELHVLGRVVAIVRKT